MDKKIVAFVIVIVLSIAGGVAFLLQNSDDTLVKEASSLQSETGSVGLSETNAPEATPLVNGSTKPGEYTEYSTTALSDAEGTKLLFFHASWCRQCRELEADIAQKGVPSGVTILKVDYDTNQDLRKKYGVTIQTTVVKVDDQGNLVEKYVPYDEPTLDSVKRNLL